MHSPRDPLPKHSILSDKLPLQYQVEQNLRSEILTRQFAKTGRLPTEVELAKHYGVSLIDAFRPIFLFRHNCPRLFIFSSLQVAGHPRIQYLYSYEECKSSIKAMYIGLAVPEIDESFLVNRRILYCWTFAGEWSVIGAI